MKLVIKRLRKINIFPRLMLVFMLLLLFTTVFITVFNQQQYTEEIRKNTLDNLTLLTQNASLKLKEEKNKLENIFTNFSSASKIIDALLQNEQFESDSNRMIVENYLLSIKENHPAVKAAIFISNNEQQYIMSKNQDFGRPYIRNLDEFLSTDIYTDAKKYSGYPVWKDSTKLTSSLIFDNPYDALGIVGTITSSAQIYDSRTGEEVGILILCIYPSYLCSTLSIYSGTIGSNSFIIGNNGMIEGIGATLSGPPFPQEREPLIKLAFSSQSGNTILKKGNDTLLVAFSSVEDFPVSVMNLTYEDVVLASAKKLVVFNYIVLFIAIVLGGFIFYILALSIDYPVRKLVRAMDKVSKGDFNAIYEAESNDEIGQLCREFDKMVNQTSKLIDKVYVQELKEKSLLLSVKNTELKALQMQINPHFLYNTLDLIRWQCIMQSGGENTASDMIYEFCCLLRMTIKGMNDRESVALSMEYADVYLKVINFRYTNKIKLIKEIDPDTANCALPYFTLQPVIENAIKHGFVGMEEDDKIIKVKSYKKDGKLYLTVSDNGKGMSEEKLNEIKQSLSSTAHQNGNSIGMCNVNLRLSLLFGSDYSIEINSKNGEGTELLFIIPAEENKNV